MSATIITADPALPPVRTRDSRMLRRLGLAAILPLGPLAITVLRGVLPYASDSSAEIVAGVAADPGAQNIVVWATLLALFALPPAMLALGRLASRGAPVLGTLALVIGGAGYLALFGLVASDTIALTAVEGGLDNSTASRVLDLYLAHPTTAVPVGVFVVGHVVGTVLLGLALGRAGLIPAWAGKLLAASQPVHLAAVIVGSRALDVLAWGVTTGMFVVAAVAVARMSDDDFDLPPVPRAVTSS